MTRQRQPDAPFDDIITDEMLAWLRDGSPAQTQVDTAEHSSLLGVAITSACLALGTFRKLIISCPRCDWQHCSLDCRLLLRIYLTCELAVQDEISLLDSFHTDDH